MAEVGTRKGPRKTNAACNQAATFWLEISVAGYFVRHIEPVWLKAPCVSPQVAGPVKPAAPDAVIILRRTGKPHKRRRLLEFQ